MAETLKEVAPSKEKIRKKKKGRKSGINVHDFDLMTKSELRYYISRLEKELKQMRIDCNISSEVKNRLLAFETQEQEKYLEKEENLAAKDFKADDTIQDFENDLTNFRIKTQYNELRKHEQQAMQSFTEFFNKSSDKSLKNKLGRKQDAERFSAVESLLSEIISMDMVACDLFGNYKNSSKEMSFEHVLKCRDAMQKFNGIKMRILNSIWDFNFSDEEPVSVEIEKLQFYFNELHEDNVKALQNWREKVTSLQDELEKVYSDLNKALILNAELQKQSSVLHIEKSASKQKVSDNELFINELPNCEIDNFAILNLELKNKLKSIEAKRKNLKNEFLSNVRKVYRKAEFDAFVAEEIMRLGIAIKEAESCDAQYRSHFAIKNDGKTKQDFEKSYKLVEMSCS